MIQMCRCPFSGTLGVVCKPTFQDLSHSVGSMPFIAFEPFHNSVSCVAIDSDVNNSCSQKCNFVKVNVEASFASIGKCISVLLKAYVQICSLRSPLNWFLHFTVSSVTELKKVFDTYTFYLYESHDTNFFKIILYCRKNKIIRHQTFIP